MHLELVCQLEQTAKVLEITYRLTNLGGADAGIFNRIPSTRPDGTLEFSAATIYLELDGDVLLARKMALPVPRNLQMAVYVPPNACLLPAGGSCGETVSIPVPVRVMQPYRRALLRGQVVADRPATSTSVTFEVGAFPVDDRCKLIAANPAFPDVLSAEPPGPAIARQTTFSKSFTVLSPIAVCDYRAEPWP